MRIGFDIDGVLVDYAASIENFLKRKYNLSYKDLGVEYLDIEDPHSCLSVIPNDMIVAIHNYKNSREFDETCVLRQAMIDIVKQLSDEGHRLYLVTNRNKEETTVTLKMLGPFLQYFRRAAFFDPAARDYFKIQRCVALRLDVYIDDQIRNAEHVADTGIKCIWFVEEPWLRNSTGAMASKVIPARVTNLISVLRSFDETNRC